MNNGVQFINDYCPVATYRNGIKIAGWEYQTVTGTELNIGGTYKDDFKSLVLSGNFEQSTPSIDNPVYPTFAGGDLCISGRNLLDCESGSATQNGVNWDYNKDIGVIALNGTSTSNTAVFPLSLNTPLSSGEYTIAAESFEGTMPEGILFIKFETLTTSSIVIFSTHTYRKYTTTFTINEPSTSIQNIGWTFLGTCTFNNFKIRVQLVKGSFATDTIPKWSAYNGAIIAVPELRALPSSTGEIAAEENITAENGVVNQQIEIDKIELTGNESCGKWAYGNLWINNMLGFSIPCSPLPSTDYVSLCSHFILKNAVGINYNTTAGFTPRNGVGIVFAIPYAELGFASLPTFEEACPVFMAWLADKYANGTPVTVWYKKTTVTTDITNTDLGQALLALRTVPYLTQVYDDGSIPFKKTAELKVEE